jgi:GT2 family glycosyltransferase
MAVPHYNVLFATPGANMLPGYVRSLLKTVKILEQQGITWNYLTEYSSLVAMARETTIGGGNYQEINNSQPMGGSMTYDKIIWIDSDIAWEPIDFFRLYESDKDIVSGCYLLQDNTATIYDEPLGMALTKEDILSRKSLFKAAGVGFGFLAVKQGVFESMKRPWFSQVEVMVKNKKTGEDEYKFPLMGEDLSWCTKAISLGYDVWVDPRVLVTHHKQMVLSW